MLAFMTIVPAGRKEDRKEAGHLSAAGSGKWKRYNEQ